MFSDLVAFVLPGPTLGPVTNALSRHGAIIVNDATDPRVNIVVTVSPPSQDLTSLCRRSRVAIVYPAWVTDSVTLGGCIPYSSTSHTIFNPKMFLGIHVTTTQLPPFMRQNIAAAVTFFGGQYSPRLAPNTTLLITNGALSSKFDEARANGVRCEPVAWLQRCVDRGLLCPFTSPHAAEIGLEMLGELLGFSETCQEQPSNSILPLKRTVLGTK